VLKKPKTGNFDTSINKQKEHEIDKNVITCYIVGCANPISQVGRFFIVKIRENKITR
jgi:hypothetical protein